MGAFLIFPIHRTELELPAVERLFARRGFAAPSKFTQGGVALWLWPKQKHGGLRFCVENGLCKAFTVGTLVYRGQGSSGSLRLLSEDWRRGMIAWKELVGSFCAGFWQDGKWSLLTDQLECQAVFVDQRSQVASSSFLGLLTALPGKNPLNRLAFAEKIATGYIVGPDTLVEGIRKVTGPVQPECKDGAWAFIPKPRRDPSAAGLDRYREACLRRQISTLETYLSGIRALANESPPVLGLSTGYDSRLLFALACRTGFPLAVQTHATAGVHDFDQSIITNLAATKGRRLVIVPTRQIQDLPEEEFASVLTDCVDFFDGRCSYDMGTFSEVYTRHYSVASLGDFALRLNGLGGEIYRNYYFDSPGDVDFRRWLHRHVYYPTARKVIADREIWEEMHRNKVAKMSATLGLDLTAPASSLVRKRYYCEIRMPECDATNNNAHNQVAYYLTPFIEWLTVQIGYQAVPFIGYSGQFQAALIEMADPNIASAPSHYGFKLPREPLRHRLKSWLKCTLPDSFWTARRDLQIRSGAYGQIYLEQYRLMRRGHPSLAEVESALQEHFPRWCWDDAQRHYAHGPTVIFMGTWLRDYNSKIKF